MLLNRKAASRERETGEIWSCRSNQSNSSGKLQHSEPSVASLANNLECHQEQIKIVNPGSNESLHRGMHVAGWNGVQGAFWFLATSQQLFWKHSSGFSTRALLWRRKANQRAIWGKGWKKKRWCACMYARPESQSASRGAWWQSCH